MKGKGVLKEASLESDYSLMTINQKRNLKSFWKL